MHPDKQEKILFVINPSAGVKSKTDYPSAIKEYFNNTGTITEYYNLTGKDDEHAIQQKIKQFSPDKVVAVGGDGTVSMVAKILLGTEIILGIIPAGSANGMARELELPANITDNLKIITEGYHLITDVINIGKNRICLHLADLGMNARLIKYFEMGKLRGKFGYAKVLMKVLWRKELLKVHLKTDQGQIKRKAFMVVFANASKYGTGAVINPHGKLNDGHFEIVVVRRLAFSEIFKTLFRPGPFNPEKIEVIQTKSASVESRHAAHFQIDGEYIGKVRSVAATISPKKLHLMISPDSDHEARKQPEKQVD